MSQRETAKRERVNKAISEIDKRYAERYPVGARVRHTETFWKRFPASRPVNEPIGVIGHVELRGGMVPAVIVHDELGNTLYSTLADNLEVL